jgi:hypothetical protein
VREGDGAASPEIFSAIGMDPPAVAGAGSGADDERFAGGFDDFARDGLQLVDLEHAADLGEETVDETDVAAGDAGDGDGFRVGEVLGGEREAELAQWRARTNCSSSALSGR